VPHFRLLPAHAPVCKVYCCLLSAFLFVLLSIDFSFDGKSESANFIEEIRNMFLPAFFFIFFYFSRGVWSRSKLLKEFGKFSLQIYLLHVVIYNILITFAPELSTNTNFALGLILFLLTLIVSYYIAYYVNNTLLIRKVVFPRELFKLNNV
jgi:peptidoglycan/LPS O-acetylase OafA/YrhL